MLTKLDIINQMLASTGTAPLTANDVSHPFYIKASNKLSTTSNSVQSPGWWFNRAIRVLKQDVGGEVILPSNTLHCDPTRTNSVLVRRAGKLYNPNTATHVIGEDVEVNFVDEVEVDDLPPQAAEYLAARATYEFYLDEDGTEPKLSRYMNARDVAWVKFRAEHLKNADVNWFNSLSHRQMSRRHTANFLPVTDNRGY